MHSPLDSFFLILLDNQHKKLLQRFSMFVSTITLLLVIIHNLFSKGYFVVGNVVLFDYVDCVLIMLCASLCGYIPALCLTTISFIANSFIHTDFAYAPSGILLAVIISYIPVHQHWYLSKRKTLLAAILFAFSAGFLWCSLLHLLQEDTVSLQVLSISFFNALIPMLLVACICHLFFAYAPERIKLLSYNGIYYTSCYNSYAKDSCCKATSRLSRHILAIIIIEAVTLSVAAVFFANLLLPKMEVDFLPPMLGHRLTDFVKRRSALAFDIKMFLLMMNVTVPLSIFANHHAQHNIAYPVRLMAKAMQDFTRNTTKQEQNAVLNVHLLPIHNKDEIGDLYSSLKIAARNLTKYIDNIEHEKRLEADLAVAQAANKAKSAFLSNMSHEIRTPINAVLGMDEMILRESTDKAILQYAADIKSASTSLLSIINDILDFSKIEAGKLEIIPVQYELSSLINDLVNMIQKRAEDKGLTLRVNVAHNMPHLLYGDDVRIKQVILNILTNAVKYTNEGSVTMNIDWRKDDDEHIQLTVEVIDTGIGIKSEDISKLFSAFERIEEKRNRTVEGTGLGMNIVQQLLAMMGSRLTVKSEYGKGSTFAFALQQKVLNWEPIGDFTVMYRKTLAANSTYKESFHAPTAKILVVDDTKLNLTVIRGLLKQTQLQIDTAESGQETLMLVKKHRYDIIFIDHRMPIMDGIETLHAMQQLKENVNQAVPCIALTANAIQGAREMYLAEGFTDYLSKPVDGEKLEKLLIKYLPAEKVVFAASNEATVTTTSNVSSDNDFPALTGIDAKIGLQNCGSAEVLTEAMQEFYNTIEEKSALIEQYAAQRDWKNYTILVHALKSSARLIGAMPLSADALHLENCGNEQNEAEIVARTPALLASYRAYKQNLAPLCAVTAQDTEKPLISKNELSEALIGIKEFVTVFDYDSADQIVQMLCEYRLPDAEKERFSQIKKHLAAVDREALLKLL